MITVPENTIVAVPIILSNGQVFSGNVSDFIRPLNDTHERDWFTSNFYKCLPLSIGNMQGFVFSVPFDFSVIWDGTNDIRGLQIILENKSELKGIGVSLSSQFGHGILTINMPVILKTPVGVNIMTIAPPNFPIFGISPMTGVVESDNLRFTFTINLKVDITNTEIYVKKDYPLAGLLPIPRYFCDSFTLVNAYDIINTELIQEEQEVIKKHSIFRALTNKKMYNNTLPYKGDGTYYKGTDILGNNFSDHQLPRKIK